MFPNGTTFVLTKRAWARPFLQCLGSRKDLLVELALVGR